MPPTDISDARLREVFSKFFPTANDLDATPYFGGHINGTFFVDASIGDSATKEKFVLQCVNTHVFRDYNGLMDNVMRISEHLALKNATDPGPDPERDHLHFFRTVSGGCGYEGPEGFWRVYRYIPRAEGRLQASSVAEAVEAARAFGRFQRLLSDIPGPRLVETIPSFHDTRKRFDNLERAAAADSEGRLASCRRDLDAFLSLRSEALKVQESFERGEMAERIVHNDAKLSNVLIDTDTGRAICVIDLDTCMPGLALHDFGDLMRSMTCDRPEDEPDTSLIVARRDFYEGLVEGFLSENEAVLSTAEKRLLPNAGVVITLEVGVRFLADYLEGDHYFRVARPDHNLVRARSQLALARSMLEKLA